MPPKSLNTNPKQYAETLLQTDAVGHLQAVAQGLNTPWWVVGGGPRDWCLSGTLATDLDIVVPKGSAQRLALALSQRWQTTCVPLDEHWGIYRVFTPDSETSPLAMIDIADTVQQASDDEDTSALITADLLRRDLTINALGWDPNTHSWIDPSGGLEDLARHTLCMVSRTNMAEDPLRWLRVFRFAATLDMPTIAPQTLSALKSDGESVVRAAPERIHYEWQRLLSAPRCYEVLRTMHDSGFLTPLFPEWGPLNQVGPNAYHHLPLPDHTLALLAVLDGVTHPGHPPHLPTLSQWPQELMDTLLTPFSGSCSRLAVTRMACLWHDLGKPATMAVDTTTNKVSFYGHEAVSAELVHGMAVRYRWSTALTQAVEQTVRWHLYPHQVMGSHVTVKTRHRFYRRLEAVMPELIALALADRYSTLGPMITPEQLEQDRQQLFDLWAGFQAYTQIVAENPPLLSGHDIMSLLNQASGPVIGQCLTQLRELQLAGEVTSPEAARAWVKHSFVMGDALDKPRCP